MVSQPQHRQHVFATGCPRCGLLWVSPRTKQSPTLYDPSGEWVQTHRVDDASKRFFLDEHLWDACDELTGVGSPLPGGQAFDFGCGNGRWLDTLERAGWRTSGLDISLKSAFARHSEITRIPTSPTFGFVVASHVLEHVTRPGKLLSQIADATISGGYIYISVPSLDGLPEHHDWHYVLNANAHLAAFSFDCLSELLGQAGFGKPHLVALPPRRDKRSNALKRLRVVAQKGAPRYSPAAPLTAALEALRGLLRDPGVN